MSERAVLVAPFWGQAHHVGVYRVERFARWLRSAGVHVVVVKAGDRDDTKIDGDLTLLTVKDPFFAVAAPQVRTSWLSRRVGPLRNIVVNALSPPDGKVTWARAVARHPAVREHARGASWVISSSPPESSHLAAHALAAATGARHVVDMRDGWLDEPLKWLLRHSRLQRAREGRLERRVVKSAHRVFVVSDVLRDMLVERLPQARDKVAVLMNCGPPDELAPVVGDRPPRARPRLLYAGRIGASNARQSAGLLLDVLARGMDASPAVHADVVFLGAFEPREHRAFDDARPRFARGDWSLFVRPPVARAQALAEMSDADGLLLLALGRGILTTKLFEYLATGRPILAVTVRDGALWHLAARVPQVFLVDAGAPAAAGAPVARFLEACARGDTWPAPEELSDGALRAVFLDQLGIAAARRTSASSGAVTSTE